LSAQDLLVEGLGVVASGGHVGITRGLVGAGGELQLVGSLEVGVANLAGTGREQSPLDCLMCDAAFYYSGIRGSNVQGVGSFSRKDLDDFWFSKCKSNILNRYLIFSST